MSEQRTSTAIRFTAHVHERLIAEAEARDVSINWLVNRAVEHMLANLVPVDEFALIRESRVM